MRLHSRHEQNTQASIDIAMAVIAAVEKHGLTYAELVAILAQEIAKWTKSEIREEREQDHPV